MTKEKFLAIGVAVAVAVASSSAFAGAKDGAKGEDGDAKKGAKYFKKRCKACHSVKKGGKHKIGPKLFGVVGRKAGSTDFKRYLALKGSGIIWDDANLDGWLADPKKFGGNKKTKMSAKTKKAGDRADLIAFMKTLK